MQSEALGTGSFETPVLPTPDGYSPMREGDSALPYSAALSSVLRPAQSTGASNGDEGRSLGALVGVTIDLLLELASEVH